MNQLREHGKEFNIYPLKLKLFTTQSDKNKLSVKEEDILKQIKLIFTQQELSTLELSTLELSTRELSIQQDSLQEELIYKEVTFNQSQLQQSKEDILEEAMQLEEPTQLDILEDTQMEDIQLEDIQPALKQLPMYLMLIFTQSQSQQEELIYKEVKLMAKELHMSAVGAELMFKDIELMF